MANKMTPNSFSLNTSQSVKVYKNYNARGYSAVEKFPN